VHLKPPQPYVSAWIKPHAPLLPTPFCSEAESLTATTPLSMTQEGALPNLSLPHVPPLTHPSTPSLTMSSTSPRKTLLPKLQQRVLKITGRRTHHRISLNMSPTLLNQLTALWVGVCLSQLLI